jgi:hypothetical protein
MIAEWGDCEGVGFSQVFQRICAVLTSTAPSRRKGRTAEAKAHQAARTCCTNQRLLQQLLGAQIAKPAIHGRVNLQDDGRFASQIGGYVAGYVRDAELFKDHAGAELL